MGPQLTRPHSSLSISLSGARGKPFSLPIIPCSARVTPRRLGTTQGRQRVRNIMVKLNLKHTALLESDNDGSITCIDLLCYIVRTKLFYNVVTLTKAHMMIPAIAVSTSKTASNGQDLRTESITTVSGVVSSSVVINSVP